MSACATGGVMKFVCFAVVAAGLAASFGLDGRASVSPAPGVGLTVVRGDGAARDPEAFEVWMADQSDTRPGFGGQILIYDGADLHGRQSTDAIPIARLDLGGAAADLCRA